MVGKVLTAFSLYFAIAIATKYSVFHNKGVWRVEGSKPDDTNVVAFINFESKQMKTGWDTVYIKTNGTQEDRLQAYGAGYGEGYLTPQAIYDSWINFVNSTFPNSQIDPAVTQYFENNYNWMNQMIIHHKDNVYWQNVALIVGQVKGLTQGYNDVAAKKGLPQLSIIQQIMVNSDGDLEDILGGIIPDSQHLRTNTASKGITNTHCSALIRPTDDWKELYSGHTTWSSYVFMLRQYKIYDFQFKNPGVVAKKTSFSSYPSCVSSIDDFYVLSSGLTVIETTNGVYNNSLYSRCSYQSLWSWIRVVLANRMAKDGRSWTQLFARYNSGTYNNQWMVVDYNKFRSGSKSSSDLLWILEQIPGQCESADLTNFVVQNGHWPSYNVPYFKDIYLISGFAAQNLSYENAPRAKIFRRDANHVQSDHEMQNMMRYNEWQTDPFSNGNPMNSISSRGDLDGLDGAFGGIDSKYTSAEMVSKMTAMGISGPTSVTQPVFNWDLPWTGTYLHVGCPPSYSFPWQKFSDAPI